MMVPLNPYIFLFFYIMIYSAWHYAAERSKGCTFFFNIWFGWFDPCSHCVTEKRVIFPENDRQQERIKYFYQEQETNRVGTHGIYGTLSNWFSVMTVNVRDVPRVSQGSFFQEQMSRPVRRMAWSWCRPSLPPRVDCQWQKLFSVWSAWWLIAKPSCEIKQIKRKYYL